MAKKKTELDCQYDFKLTVYHETSPYDEGSEGFAVRYYGVDILADSGKREGEKIGSMELRVYDPCSTNDIYAETYDLSQDEEAVAGVMFDKKNRWSRAAAAALNVGVYDASPVVYLKNVVVEAGLEKTGLVEAAISVATRNIFPSRGFSGLRKIPLVVREKGTCFTCPQGAYVRDGSVPWTEVGLSAGQRQKLGLKKLSGIASDDEKDTLFLAKD